MKCSVNKESGNLSGFGNGVADTEFGRQGSSVISRDRGAWHGWRVQAYFSCPFSHRGRPFPSKHVTDTFDFLLSNTGLFAVSKPCLFRDSVFLFVVRFLGRRQWRRERVRRGRENWRDRKEREERDNDRQ